MGETVPVDVAAFDYVEKLEATQDPVEIRRLFEEKLRDIGATNFALIEYSLVTSTFQRGVIDDHMPDEWKQRYFQNNYVADDPVVKEVMVRLEPFLWSEVLDKGGHAKKERRVVHEASEFGMNDGIVVPIFGPKGYAAMMTLAGPHLEMNPRLRASIHMIALYTHNRLTRLLRSERSIVNLARTLTGREIECLQWVAQGKSDWEIGEILTISEATAHGYVESAKRKIGVATRMQAVVGAMLDGALRI
jgi:LuxR family quorum sensing-dependent transcriptional regulator